MLKELNDSNFQEEVLDYQGLVLVDFWATWCAPCKMMLSVLQELAKDKPKVKICKLNIDDSFELATRYNVVSVPTFIVFKNGKQLISVAGVRPKSALISMLDES
jgi:thioredoxin 1